MRETNVKRRGVAAVMATGPSAAPSPANTGACAEDEDTTRTYCTHTVALYLDVQVQRHLSSIRLLYLGALFYFFLLVSSVIYAS